MSTSSNDRLGLTPRELAVSYKSQFGQEDAEGPQDVEASIETEKARFDRLGRERPEKFTTLWSEIAFCFSICMSQILTEYFVSGFNVILPTLTTDLSIPAASATWPASAFSLVVSAFLLIFGRLADIHGGRVVYIGGMAWLALWSLAAGFSRNELMLDFCRALQGFGPSAFLPSSLMLIGSAYRPGPRKNLVFSLYGACAALGFFCGIFFAGVAGEFIGWGWYFFIGAILAGLTTATAWVSIPADRSERRDLGVKMDWLGALFIASGLILVVFAVTDSAHAPQGWRTPYIYVTFVVGALLLCVAAYVEGWVATAPLLPVDLFSTPYMKPLVLALFLTYGGMGILLLYGTFYMENILGGTPMQLVAWWSPTAIGGCIIATAGGLLLHVLPGTALIIFAGVAWIVAPLLFAIAPIGAGYWPFFFPAMVCATLGIDITFNITNIFITTSMPLHRQGLAGALINSILQLSIAFFLGAGDILVTRTSGGRLDQQSLRIGYKAAFWFEVGLAAAGLLVMVLFVKIDKAASGMTADERLAAEREKTKEGAGDDEVVGRRGVEG